MTIDKIDKITGKRDATNSISRIRDCDACALQRDKSADLAGLAILLVFVR